MTAPSPIKRAPRWRHRKGLEALERAPKGLTWNELREAIGPYSTNTIRNLEARGYAETVQESGDHPRLRITPAGAEYLAAYRRGRA